MYMTIFALIGFLGAQAEGVANEENGRKNPIPGVSHNNSNVFIS
jgi:hypothetical protein